NQEWYYTAVLLPQDQWVQFTAMQLTGGALSWWRNSGLTNATPWRVFSTTFTAYFTPPYSANMARRALDLLKQNTSSIATYM
ncbi:hypothetical protein BGZ46_004332, partial [Entomortierella lignicola]